MTAKMLWCWRCQKLVLARVTTVFQPSKKTIKYDCPYCSGTIMVDEYAGYPKI